MQVASVDAGRKQHPDALETPLTFAHCLLNASATGSSI